MKKKNHFKENKWQKYSMEKIAIFTAALFLIFAVCWS